MTLSNVSFRMDQNLKNNMKNVCQELGMDMTTAFVIYAKKLTRERRIPFEVSADPFFSDANKNALEKSLQQFNEGKTITKNFDELEAMEL